MDSGTGLLIILGTITLWSIACFPMGMRFGSEKHIHYHEVHSPAQPRG